nr:MBL fold metallo-hydrolase [uncultured Flavonifractor sp.]
MKIRVMQVGAIGTNCYLLEDEHTHTAAVVDPGDEADRILALAKEDGMEIGLILLTHAHYDHTSGVAGLHKALPHIPVYLHPDDAGRLGNQLFPDLGMEPTLYRDGDLVKVGGIDVQVLHTPGHTPGGVCLMAGDALFTGDTLFQGSMGRTDLPGGSYEELMASLARLARLPGDFHVLPGHMDVSSLETERNTNYYMQAAMG